MPVVVATPDHLCSVFAQRGGPEPVLLIGAGASVKSGIPASEGVAERASRWGYCSAKGLSYDDPREGRRSDVLRWVRSQPWYQTEKSAEDNYSRVLRNVLNVPEHRKEFFLRLLNPGVPPSVGYERLLDLIADQYVTSVLTTNFDHILTDAKTARLRPHHIQVIRTEDDLDTFSTRPKWPQLVYLHGSVEHHTDQNLLEEVQRLNEQLVDKLVHLLRDHPLVVVGYRGAEPSVMRHLLQDQRTCRFRNGLYWCALDLEHLHPLVHELAAVVGGGFQLVQIGGFDALLTEIASRCDRHAPKSRQRGGQTNQLERLPFELRPVVDSELEELDWLRIKSVIIAYCKKMDIPAHPDPDRSWLVERLRELDLVTLVNDELKPTCAGYLLFAIDPAKRMPCARTQIVVEGREERTLSGNLFAQLESIRDVLDAVNRPFVLKATTSKVIFPYPKAAIRELPVNALVHRDYEQQGAIAIEIQKDQVRFVNPGGLVEEVAEKVRPSIQQQVEMGVRIATGYRNAVIADLFCGAEVMEKLGSGLSDVFKEVKKNGGRAIFGPVDEANTYFHAVLYRPLEEIDERTNTAIPAANRSRYYTNLLEVSSIPSRLWSVIVDVRNLLDLPGGIAPPFIQRSDGTVLTFAEPHENPTLSKALLQGSVRPIQLEAFTGPRCDSRDLVFLMNRCLYRALARRSLVVDEDRKRAYFPRTTQGNRTVRYPATLRTATRSVTKPFVSRTSQKVLYWEHEAIWFGFERFRESWALRILPGYVFTLDGGEQLMDHRRVGALATRKAARDFNQQVLNDLVFWSWVLGEGHDSFTIETGGEPIVLLGSVANCELEVPAEADLPFAPDEKKLDREIELLEEEIAEEKEAEAEFGDTQ